MLDDQPYPPNTLAPELQAIPAMVRAWDFLCRHKTADAWYCPSLPMMGLAHRLLGELPDLEQKILTGVNHHCTLLGVTGNIDNNPQGQTVSALVQLVLAAGLAYELNASGDGMQEIDLHRIIPKVVGAAVEFLSATQRERRAAEISATN